MTRQSRQNPALRWADVHGAHRPVTTVPRPTITYLTQFQSGHGWLDQGGTTGGSANLNNTGVYERGTQSVSVSVPASAAANRTVRAPSFAAVDLTNKKLALLMMVDQPTNLGVVQVTIGNSGYTNFIQTQALSGGGASPTVMEANTWTWLYFDPYAEQTSSSGTPTKTGVTDMQIRVNNQASGAVTVWLGAVGYFTNPTTVYTPNGGVVSFTFDDCFASQMSIARPALDAQNWPADAFVITDVVGTSGYLTLAQLQQLQQHHNWTINAHAYTSANHALGLSNMTTAQVEQDLRNCKNWLHQNGFGKSDLYAYPLGRDNPTVDAQVRQYFSFARHTFNRPYQSPYAEPTAMRVRSISLDNAKTISQMQALVDSAYTNGWWLILVVHDLNSGGTNNATTWQTADFQTLVNYIATKGIPVRSIADVLALR